ncbi:MAG TPA: alpha/beta hydrolase family protein [Chloroflexota bacterium]
MSIATVQFRSKALARQTTYTALLPDASVVGPGPYPVLYQLHGRSDSHSAWLVQTGIARYVARLPLIVVMPEGAISAWLNHGETEQWEDLIMQDLPAHLASTYQARTDRAGTVIGGLSIGGFGSTRLALRFPDRFASVAAHSAPFFSAEEWLARDGKRSRGPENDPYALAEQVSPATLPTLRIDCGTEDGLIDSNRRFHAHLERLGLAHTYAVYPGAHTWDYWDTHVQEAIAQHCQGLGIGNLSS